MRSRRSPGSSTTAAMRQSPWTMPVNTDSADVPGEELEAAAQRELRRGRVVAASLVSVEPVIGVVHMDHDSRLRFADLVDVGQRNVRVLRAEMHHHRALGFPVELAGNAAAIVGDRTGDTAEIGRGEPCDQAAEAIADNADLAEAFAIVDRGLHV